MVSQEEYERIVESFLWEMQAICAALTAEDLRKQPDFIREVQESLATFRNPAVATEDVVGFAFGIVDEFVHVSWAEVMKESYALYVDMSNGKSHRHPTSYPT